MLNADNYRVSERRQKTILIASGVGPGSLPTPPHSQDGTGNLELWTTARSAFSGTLAHPLTTELSQGRTELLGLGLSGVFTMSDIHFGRNPNALSLELHDDIPPGSSRFHLSDRPHPRSCAEGPIVVLPPCLT